MSLISVLEKLKQEDRKLAASLQGKWKEQSQELCLPSTRRALGSIPRKTGVREEEDMLGKQL